MGRPDVVVASVSLPRRVFTSKPPNLGSKKTHMAARKKTKKKGTKRKATKRKAKRK
jgi:hypothetical protein